MKIEITSVNNPQWGDSAHTVINADITTNVFGDEVIPFTATPYDVEEHGRKLYQELIDGKHGQIAEYAPIDVPPSLEELLKTL